MADLGHLGKPMGIIGKLFGWMMDRYNKLEHVETIKSLDLQPANHVLEIAPALGIHTYYRIGASTVVGTGCGAKQFHLHPECTHIDLYYLCVCDDRTKGTARPHSRFSRKSG